MVYKAIGLMSGSRRDGLAILLAEFHENGGVWTYEIKEAACYSYSPEWKKKLETAITLSSRDYLLLHAAYGHYLGKEVNRFIEQHHLQYQVALVASHGHTTFHFPGTMTAQLGDGSALAAETGLPVISDLRSLDVAFGGQGAPIVPIGENLLFPDYNLFLNLGGIANVSIHSQTHIAFDICPANRVLNMLAQETGKEYDENGALAAEGQIMTALLEKLNAQPYYHKEYPKSLSNDFGTEILYTLIKNEGISIPDALRTYIEHICQQTSHSLEKFPFLSGTKLLVTGGGAFNNFLVSQLSLKLQKLNIEVEVPAEKLVNYKEALVMALMGVLRWREEYNVIPSVTGAERASIGGALWNGQEA